MESRGHSDGLLKRRFGERRVDSVARAVLSESPYRELQQVACRYDDGVLTLSGRVPSFYLRQVAVTCVRDCVAGIRIVDQLEVDPCSTQFRR